MTDTAKNIRIKESYAKTLAKRATQSCRVYTVKVQTNKLNKQQREHLKMLFVEAKWMYNHVLSLSKRGDDIYGINYKDLGTVTHLDKDRNPIETELKHLSSQMRQAVIDGICGSIKGLSHAKAKGEKVGRLKFISEYTSINLKQASVSYKLVGKDRVKLQGLRKPIKVNGLGQVLSLGEHDLANAKLIQRNGDYYVAITVYAAKKDNHEPKQMVGIDLGCKTCVTLSNGEKHECRVEETERIKELRRRISRSVKGSNNRRKLCLKLRKKEQELASKRDDFANKLCHMLDNYVVVMQDEQIAQWAKSRHGKAVSYGALGRVKDKLMKRDDTIVLSKWCPTTKLCAECGERVPLKLSERTFVCPRCGHTHDRDVHAAENMLWFAEHKIGVGRTVTLEEILKDIERLFQSDGTVNPQEAAKPLGWR